MPDDKNALPRDRRAVFRLGFQRLLNPIADFVESRLKVPLPEPRTCLRPPGAVPEKEFLDRCYRCGNCVDVCPVKAIRPLANGGVERTGTPYIDADLSPCTVCDTLACMRACPSGALQLVPEPRAIRMGLARPDHGLCLRHQGEDCTICIDKCPFGPEAIGVTDAGEVVVRSPGCVGCGVCQFYCPARPKAIEIRPY